MRMIELTEAEAHFEELVSAIKSGDEDEIVIMVQGRTAARILPIPRESLRRFRHDTMFERAEAILEGRRNGFGMPILRRLALRKHGPAMLSLAGRETRSGNRGELGRFQDAHSPAGLMYRAYRQGELNSAQNLAMTYSNMGDLAGYRLWLRRAARLGDNESAREAHSFDTRQPHGLARRLHRLRPFRRDGG